VWPFSRKQKQEQGSTALTDLIDDRDLKDLSNTSAVLRVWLPEEGRTALDQVVKKSGTMSAKYLREFFVVYLYGVHELIKMQERQEGLYYVPPPIPTLDDERSTASNGDVRYSRSPSVECIPGLGKNIFPLKIYLPQRMRDDLQRLADKVNIPLSQFTREILISYFFGQTFWSAKLKTWSAEQELIGTEWEEGLRESKEVSYGGPTPTQINDDQVVNVMNYF
jgi:hypothetical protein